VKASIIAIDKAGLKPEDLDLIILNTLTPDMRDPGTAPLIQAMLGAKNAAAFDINVGGCAGGVYALSIGAMFITGGAYRNVLVIGADIMSSIVPWRDRLVASIFGDSAGAVVLSRCNHNGLLSHGLWADGTNSDATYIPKGTSGYPYPFGSVNPGFPFSEINGKLDGRKIWDFGTKVFHDSVSGVAREIGIPVSEIDLLISHQANTNIIKEGMKRLGMPMEKTFVNVDKYGNTSSGSVYIALGEALDQRPQKPGNVIALTAFGAGLSWGAAFFKVNAPEDFS
jgi:3-oxoacyl-[acyl-carrier-protein] synthase-3